MRVRKEPLTIFAISAQSQIFPPQVPYGHFSRARLFEDGLTYLELFLNERVLNLIRSMSSKSSAPAGLARLMDSEKYSDLKFMCQGQEFKVHKAIVCTQSSVLAAACDGGFQVKPAKKAPVRLS